MGERRGHLDEDGESQKEPRGNLGKEKFNKFKKKNPQLEPQMIKEKILQTEKLTK